MNQRSLPRTPELPEILACPHSVAIDVVSDEGAHVLSSARPVVDPMTLPRTLVEGTCVLATILPFFHSAALVHIKVPFTLVLWCRCKAIFLVVDAQSMGYISCPLSHVLVTGLVHETTIALGHVVLPLAFVACAIAPGL